MKGVWLLVGATAGVLLVLIVMVLCPLVKAAGRTSRIEEMMQEQK